MDFQHIGSRLPGKISRPPGPGKDFVNDLQLGVDPHHGEIEIHKQHMDGRVDSGVALPDQDEPFLRREMREWLTVTGIS